MNPRVLKRFVIICGISTFVMFTVWMLIKSFRDRPPGDYETQICDQRLKDKLWDQAIEQANKASNLSKQAIKTSHQSKQAKQASKASKQSR